ncbi:MAG: pyridoxal-phosphate dependent enzyme [Planctomycetes bacterium]|nr:pyridoxal-phosphate dependent enzyme [Planctomycetota bacterium]
MTTVTPPTLNEVTVAAKRLEAVAIRTPLVALHSYDCASDILLKPEILQPVTSFKIRGIYYAVASLSDQERARGISTVSAGNTAQALAWCGRHFGIPARSLMPDSAPQSKIDAVRAYGGEPVLVPVDEVFRYLREHGWEDEPYSFIHPWTSRDVMIGHGSIALEIIEDFPEVESVFIPVGGGGLMGGVGSTLKALKPSVKVFAVEPEGCPSLHVSLQAGQPMSVDCNTICDGVAVPYITDEMFPLLQAIVDESVLVSEEAVKSMVKRLAMRNKIIAEPSGALAAAAATNLPLEKRGRCVCLVTGGSIDRAKLMAILET